MLRLDLRSDVNPPPHPANGELPLTAQLQGKYRGVSDSLELAAVQLVYAGLAGAGFWNSGGYFDTARFGFDLEPG